MDNVFVISMVFTYLAIPRMYQHRVLFWGIIGVIVLRALMIGLGAALVSQFSWILYIFAIFLIGTGILMFRKGREEPNMADSKILLWLKKRMNVTPELHGNKFSVNLPDPKTGKLRWFATPLLLALMFVEIVDLVFAIDSVPAIFGVTKDPHIVFFSNIFAIMGLRSLFFMLSGIMHLFSYLKYGLAVILVFIGTKMFFEHWLESVGFNHVWSLLFIVLILAGSMLASTLTPEARERRRQAG
jgi:tellurite resistance protein TerC